ncbi:MAG: ABC transporter substrate-binding protein [Acutalibacteraceae bacterium]
MKKFTKILSVVLCLALVLTAFAACGSKEETTTAAGDTSAPAATDTDKTYTVGICQLVQHEALDAATQGFKDALTEKLGDKITFDEQNAANDIPACSTIVNKFVSSKVDLIMANATPALQAAVSATTEIPIVGTSVTDYATALDMDVDTWTGKTGINATGTSDCAPLDEQAEMILALVPDVKTVGIIYCSGEANSKFQVNAVKAYLEEKDVTVNEYPFADSNGIAAVVTKAVSECDALYAPTDNTVADNTEIVNNIAEPAGIPLFAGEEGICKGCGVATFSFSYYDIGYQAGEMAYEILVNGKDPADMEIGYCTNPVKEYVKDRADALNITIPDDYKEIVVEAD